MSTETKAPMRIVVGMDLSETGDDALREALQLRPRSRHTELHITHVIKPKHTGHGPHLDTLCNSLDETLTTLEARTTAVLRKHSFRRSQRTTLVFHVKIGEPSTMLHQVAVDVNADLIIIGNGTHGGVPHWLAGSVAEDLLHSAHLPVLVTRPRHFEQLPRSEQPEPPRADQDMASPSLTEGLHLEFVDRTTHISGLL